MNPTQPSRRNFLKQASTLAAAGAVASQLVVPRGVYAAENDVIKVGFIGCGGRGSGAAAQALAANPNNHLTAIGDMFPERAQTALKSLKAKYESQVKVTPETTFSGFDAYKKVIDSDVDVVLLTTPPGFRPMHFKYAVEKGKHVFAEKPVCVDATGFRSFQESVALAKQKGLGFVDGFCWRYNAAERQTFPRIHDGAIGDILSIYSHYNASELWSVPRKEGMSDMEWQLRNWLYFVWLSGDHLVEQAVHTVDKVAWAMKDVPPVRCWGTGGRQSRVDPAFGHIWDHFAIVYEWANGARAHMYCRQQDNVQGGAGVKDCFVGTKGVCDIKSTFSPKDGAADYVIRQHGDKGEGWRLSNLPNPYPNAYQVEHDELFASIRAGKPINAGERVANSAMLAIMGRMAAYTGKPLTWEQAINSKENTFPEKLEMGSLKMPPVAVPGKTKLV